MTWDETFVVLNRAGIFNNRSRIIFRFLNDFKIPATSCYVSIMCTNKLSYETTPLLREMVEKGLLLYDCKEKTYQIDYDGIRNKHPDLFKVVQQ